MNSGLLCCCLRQGVQVCQGLSSWPSPGSSLRDAELSTVSQQHPQKPTLNCVSKKPTKPSTGPCSRTFRVKEA